MRLGQIGAAERVDDRRRIFEVWGLEVWCGVDDAKCSGFMLGVGHHYL
jgi:hypothetical protein